MVFPTHQWSGETVEREDSLHPTPSDLLSTQGVERRKIERRAPFSTAQARHGYRQRLIDRPNP